MGQSDTLVSRGFAVYYHEFSQDDAYVSCGCNRVDDNPLLKFSEHVGVGEYYKLLKQVKRDEYSYAYYGEGI